MFHHLHILLALCLSLFILHPTYAESAHAETGFGLIHCRYTLNELNQNALRSQHLHVTFDIGRLDEEDLVKVWDQHRHESIGIYPILRQQHGHRFEVTFQIIDEADNTIFFKLIYPENGGQSEFYTKIEAERWVNMCDDTVTTARAQLTYAGQCRFYHDVL